MLSRRFFLILFTCFSLQIAAKSPKPPSVYIYGVYTASDYGKNERWEYVEPGQKITTQNHGGEGLMQVGVVELGKEFDHSQAFFNGQMLDRSHHHDWYHFCWDVQGKMSFDCHLPEEIAGRLHIWDVSEFTQGLFEYRAWYSEVPEQTFSTDIYIK